MRSQHVRSTWRNTAASVAAVAIALAACDTADPEQPQQNDLAPTFAPLTATPFASAEASPGISNPASPAPGSSPDATASSTFDPSPQPSASGSRGGLPPGSSTSEDPTGDTAAPLALITPDYADLTRGELARSDEYQLTISLASAPPEFQTSENVLNIASFYDVDGDGVIDYEVWASQTSDGWGTSWYDIRATNARFGADDDVTVQATGSSVVLTFPTAHLGDANRFRWAVALEWGTFLTIDTDQSARDYMPDQGPVLFPN